MSKNYLHEDGFFMKETQEKVALFSMFLFMLFFMVGCEVISSPFPKGFRRISSKLEVWENRQEGFEMTLVTNAKRAEGFLEWRSLGVYGRITELKTEGQTFTFSLGDGGMGGAEFSATARKGILEVHCTQKLRASAAGSAQTRELAVNATPLKSAKAFRMLTASYDETPEKGREFSLWLQYLEAVQKNQIPVLDEVLRRSRSPYQMAGFRLTQQKKDYLTVYKAITSTIPSQDGAPGGGAKSAVPAFQYEEVEYPVFISDDMVSIATQNYLLNGGAHGLASTGFDVIDLKRGKRLDVKDVLGGDAWKRALAPLLKDDMISAIVH